MKQLSFLVLILMAVSGCKKSSEEANTTTILTSTKWQLKQLLLESPLGNTPADITLTTLKPCEFDDVIEFKTGGLYSCAEYKDICAAGGNNSLLFSMNGGSWALSKEDSVITISKGTVQQIFRFSSKTSSQVQIYQQQKNFLDQLVRYTYVLKAVE